MPVEIFVIHPCHFLNAGIQERPQNSNSVRNVTQKEVALAQNFCGFGVFAAKYVALEKDNCHTGCSCSAGKVCSKPMHEMLMGEIVQCCVMPGSHGWARAKWHQATVNWVVIKEKKLIGRKCLQSHKACLPKAQCTYLDRFEPSFVWKSVNISQQMLGFKSWTQCMLFLCSNCASIWLAFCNAKIGEISAQSQSSVSQFWSNWQALLDSLGSKGTFCKIQFWLCNLAQIQSFTLLQLNKKELLCCTKEMLAKWQNENGAKAKQFCTWTSPTSGVG